MVEVVRLRDRVAKSFQTLLVDTKVILTEPGHIGAETIVHARIDGVKAPVVARLPGSPSVRHGERVLLVPDLSRAVMFDA